MSKYIIQKNNGVTSNPVERKKYTSSSPVLEKNEKAFSDILEPVSAKECGKDTLMTIHKDMKGILNELTKDKEGKKVIESLYNNLKIADSKEDLLEIFSNLIQSHRKIISLPKPKYEYNEPSSIKHLKEAIENHTDLVLSVMIKRIIAFYYMNTLLALGKDKIAKLEELKNNGIEVDELLYEVGESFDEISIKNGVANLSKRLFMDIIDIAYDKTRIHLCWENCKNASPLVCPKIADKLKKDIADYDFIRSGHEIIDSRTGRIIIVTDCDKYVEEVRERPTLEQIAKYNRLKSSIKEHYFDAGSLEEANKIEDYLSRTHKLGKTRRCK